MTRKFAIGCAALLTACSVAPAQNQQSWGSMGLMMASTVSVPRWKPPAWSNVWLEATFEPPFLLKDSNQPAEPGKFCRNAYAPAPFFSSIATNNNPYLGFYDSETNTDQSAIISLLPSGNSVGVASYSNAASYFVCPDYTGNNMPWKTSTTWSVTWWCYPTNNPLNSGIFGMVGQSGTDLFRTTTNQYRWANIATFSCVITTNVWQLWTITSKRRWYIGTSLINDSTDYTASLSLGFYLNTSRAAANHTNTMGYIDDVYVYDGYELTTNDIQTILDHGDPSTRSQ